MYISESFDQQLNRSIDAERLLQLPPGGRATAVRPPSPDEDEPPPLDEPLLDPFE